MTICRPRSIAVVLIAAAASALGRPAPAAAPTQLSPPARPPILSSTFASRGTPQTAASVLNGRWESEKVQLVLLPRPATDGVTTGSIFGAVPGGPHEGVFSLTPRSAESWRGFYIRARTMTRAEATIQHVAADDSIVVAIAGTAALRFRRAGGVNLAAVQSHTVICHRGLSLGRRELMNTSQAIRESFAFGCSGVELDVTVPYGAARTPLPHELRVYHPPDLRAELTGLDSAALDAVTDALPLEAALTQARQAHVPFVYLDPKLRWLLPKHRAAAREALERIVHAAAQHLASGSGHTVAIGSETSGVGEAADLLADIRRSRPWPGGLVAALEITRGTDLQQAQARLRRVEASNPPEIVSYNLLRLSDGGGGVLRWFLSTIPRPVEDAFAQLPQAVIYWTASSDDQFAGTLKIHSRMSRGRNKAMGIITPYPHRLVFHLATSRAHGDTLLRQRLVDRDQGLAENPE